MKDKTDDLPADDESPRARRLDLPERLDINAADELAEALEHLREGPLDIHAGKISQMSALCLQVLVATKRQWEQDEMPFRLIDETGAFAASLERLGIPADFFAQDMAT